MLTVGLSNLGTIEQVCLLVEVVWALAEQAEFLDPGFDGSKPV